MEAKKIYEVVFDTKDDRFHVEFASSRTAAQMLAEHENQIYIISHGICDNFSAHHGKYIVVEHNVHTIATAKEAISKEVIPELACYRVDVLPVNMSKDKLHVARIISISRENYLAKKCKSLAHDDGSATIYVCLDVSGHMFENINDIDECFDKLQVRIKKEIESSFGDKFNIIHFI